MERLEDRWMLAADVFEPNDSLSEAFDLFTGDQSYSDLTIHEPGNDDWYKWSPHVDGSLTVDISFVHAGGDLDLQLLDSAQNLLDGSFSTTDNEEVTHNVAAGQDYYIWVYGFNNATHDNYFLSINGPGVGIPLDRFEPNSEFAEAAYLGMGDQTQGGLTVHKDPIEQISIPDWFQWTASESGTLSIDVQFSHVLGDLDAELLDAGQNVLDQSVTVTDNEQLTVSVTAGQEYYLHVYGFANASNPGYALVIDGPDIAADVYEPNDDFSTASDLGRTDLVLGGLTIHAPGNDDWYRWTPVENGTLNVDVLFSDALGDLDVRLLDSSGATVLDGSFSTTDNEQVSSSVLADQAYYIHIYGFNNAVNREYDLLVDGPELLPDNFEPNNSFFEAVDLGYFNQHRGGLGIHNAGEEDWFEWTALNGGPVDFEILFSDAAGNLELELYDAEQTLLASALSTTDNEFIPWDANAGDEYYVRVYGHDQLAVIPDYELQFELTTESENYAVLFSGGINAGNNHVRYYDATRDLYETLIDDQGLDLDPDNVFVLFADGTNPAADNSESPSENSDMSYATNVLAATPANLQTTLTTTLPNLIDSNDHFLFWSFDHGDGKHKESTISYNYNINAPTITGEEQLNAWGNSHVDDNDLANWLNQIPGGHGTLVFSQCFAGGMLDNFLPMATTGYGMAATNHYEFSYGKAFADAFNEALEQGHISTNDAYVYAHDHDSYAATRGTYVENAGTYSWGVEHPWAATSTNFPIFADSNNNSPNIAFVSGLEIALPLTELPITYDLLSAAADMGDQDGQAISFRIESVDVGSITSDGIPIIPGETILRYGQSLVWHKPEGVDGTIEAFSVRAYDGATVSDQRVNVPIRIGDPAGIISAVDDVIVMVENQNEFLIPVLDNDEGAGAIFVIGVGQPSHGTVILSEGQVRYTPVGDWSGLDSFSYFITDSSGETDVATVEVTVLAVNDAPVALAETVTVLEGSVDNVIAVLENDFDPDLDPLLAVLTGDVEHGELEVPTAVVRTAPWHGALELNPDASFRYTPQPGYVGPDSFMYVVNDGQLSSNEVIVSINVEAPSGDFNGDGNYDCIDINALVAEIAAGTHDTFFDLTGDSLVDLADRNAWLIFAGEANLGPGRPYLVGDANLDGFVDGLDFIVWNQNKFTPVAAWCAGDFTADGVVDGLDFIVWNENKFQSSDVFFRDLLDNPHERGDVEHDQAVSDEDMRFSADFPQMSPLTIKHFDSVFATWVDRREDYHERISDNDLAQFTDDFPIFPEGFLIA